MRVLASFTGGSGHFLPTLPVARALRARGHDVVYTCQERMAAAVADEGFPVVPSGGRTLLDPGVRRPLQPLDRAAEEAVVREHFAGSIAAERAGRLAEVVAQVTPDVVLRDEMDFGACVVAEASGLPHAAVVVIAAGGLVRPDVVAAPLDTLRRAYGLAPDPTLAALHRWLTLVPAPPRYRDPRDPLPVTAHHIRPAVLDQPQATGRSGSSRRLVYFTLGTIFHQESGDLFSRVLSGLRQVDADVVVTVGREIDAAELGPQPAHVKVEQFVPQAQLLPRCHVVVSHAGSGTVIGALAHGVPSVLLPMGADQPLNADRCNALGVAEVLDPVTCTGDDVRQAVRRVLDEPSYAAAARALAAETARLPGSDHAARLLEALVTR